jgi:hypothetical protein
MVIGAAPLCRDSLNVAAGWCPEGKGTAHGTNQNSNHEGIGKRQLFRRDTVFSFSTISGINQRRLL